MPLPFDINIVNILINFNIANGFWKVEINIIIFLSFHADIYSSVWCSNFMQGVAVSQPILRAKVSTLQRC